VIATCIEPTELVVFLMAMGLGATFFIIYTGVEMGIAYYRYRSGKR
jgi:hypothetical protein